MTNVTPLFVSTPTDDITWALQAVQGKARDMHIYHKYYDGHHDLLFATEKFRNAFGSLFRAFADNLCPAVVDTPADRLIVSGFDGKLAEAAHDLWKKARMATASGQVHHDAFKLGDAYLIVWPNVDGEVSLWPQACEQCVVEYDDENRGRIIRAAKVWMVQTGPNAEKWRVTLYYPDRIERFISKRKHGTSSPQGPNAFTPYDDGSGSYIPNPYDVVPMFHFPNNNSIGSPGRSELQNVIPLQNALNKAICDMLVAMEYVAMPQRWATGLQIEVDPVTGKPKAPPFTPGVERVWTAGEQVKFGEFEQAQLGQFLEVQDNLRTEIARVSGTPLHILLLGDSLPSGEAMRVSEARLIKKIEDRQTCWGDIWTDALLLALRQQGGPDTADNSSEIVKTPSQAESGEPKTSKSTKSGDNEQLSIVWTNPAPHNPLFDAETQLVKQQVGLSKRQSLRELGYSDQQIEEFKSENEEDETQKLERESKFGPAGVPNAFNRNGPPGQASQPAPKGGQANAEKQAARRNK